MSTPASDSAQTLPALDPAPMEFEGKQVAICLPQYKITNPITMFSVMGLIDLSKVTVLMQFGDAFVTHSRNALASRFLKSGLPWSLWIDDDMVVPIGKARWFNDVTKLGLPDSFAGQHVLKRLMSHGKTLVGALYAGRHENGKPMYYEGCASDQERAYVRLPRDVVKPTKWVATGCMLVHRQVFLDISKRFPHLDGHWFSPSEHDLLDSARRAVAVLKEEKTEEDSRLARALQILKAGLHVAEQNSRMGTGEDVIFCYRATEAGHQPHVDLGCIAGHIGTKVYSPTNTH